MGGSGELRETGPWGGTWTSFLSEFILTGNSQAWQLAFPSAFNAAPL